MQPAMTTEDKMAKHGKKYKAALAKVDLDKEYSSRETKINFIPNSTHFFNVPFESTFSSSPLTIPIDFKPTLWQAAAVAIK